MASLHHLPNGKWQVRWREHGKQHGANIDTKRQAVREFKRLTAHESAATPMRAGAILDLVEIINRWEMAKVADGRNKDHMALAAVKLRSLVTRQGWQRADAVTPLAVQDWKAHGCRRTGCLLKGALRWAFVVLDQPVHPRALELLSSRPTKRIAKRQLLTEATVALILERAARMSDSAYALLHCLSVYGWRPITAAKLTVGSVDLASGAITTEIKSGDEHPHPLMPGTMLLLKPLVAFRKPSDPLFINPTTGRAWRTQSGISEWFRGHFAEAFPGVCVYDLKRYAITSMLRRGMRREQVVVFTGHRVLAQVDTYTVSNEESKREALAALVNSMEQKGTGSALQRIPGH